MLRRFVCGFAGLVVLWTPWKSAAQTINTIVGNAINDGRPALQTPMVRPQGLALDAAGNLLIADRGQFVIRRVSATTGISTVLAGGGNVFDDAIPVPGRSAALDYPLFLVVGPDGSIYFSSFNDYRIRKITPGGLVTTVAGTGRYGYSGDGGKATLAELSTPSGVALDRSGNLYFSDSDNSRVRRVNLNTGIIDTVAGNGTYGYSGDNGPATQARLGYPWGLAVDAAGNLYIADSIWNASRGDYDDVVRKVSNSIITTPVPESAGLDTPKGLAFDPAGRLHIADRYNYRVVRLESAGNLTVVAGGGRFTALPEENVPATSTDLFGPTGLAFDSSGNLFISEEGWNLVRRVDAATGRIRTVAGTLDVLDGGPAISAPLAFPIGIAVGAQGSIFIADTDHHRIRRVDTNGTIQTVAGNGVFASAPDGVLAAGSPVSSPLMVSLDSRGNLLFTEAYSVVRRLDLATGRLSTVAGIVYDRGFSGENGPATNARLDIPVAAVADSSGNVYISDRDNHCVRRVNPQGVIRAVAGICAQEGYSGDGGPAINAKLSIPTGLAFDLSGNLLIADTGNSLVRRLNVATGTIERVAGKPQSWGYSGDGGPPLEAELGSPVGLAVGPNGAIFLTDDGNSVVRVIRGNVILTLAGVGASGFYGDGGEAQFAWLNIPEGVALDGSGNVLVVDSNNNRVRRINLATATLPVLGVEPTSLSFRAPQGGAPPPVQGLNIRNTGSGYLAWAAEVRTSSGGPWLRLSDNAGTAPATLHVGVIPEGLAAGTYQGTILIRSSQASNSPVTVPVTLTVEASLPPALSLSTQFLRFEAVQGGTAPSPQIFSISNSGSGSLNWATQTLTSSGENWLLVTPGSGTTQAGGSSSRGAVSVNPEGLSPGLYLGIITVTNLNANASTPVTVSLSVKAPTPRILLSTKSFVFTFVQGSTSVPAQSFRILNVGGGTVEWQAVPLVSQGDWLQVTPASGTSDAANLRGSPTVTLTVDPSELAPGVYGAAVFVLGSGFDQRVANVIVRVLPPGTPPIPQVQPAGLLFTGTAGSSPLVQEVSVQTTGGGALNFTVGFRTQDGAGWLTASPPSGTLFSSSDRTRVRVQVAPGSLPAGVYQGAVTFSFNDGRVREVAVAAILRGPTAVLAAAGDKAQGETCAAIPRQVLVSTRLTNNFSLPTGWPVPLTVGVYNGCGDPLTTSTVAASFSNGDPPIVLVSLRDGQYIGTWVPTRLAPGGPGVQVTLRALNPELPEGTYQLTGSLALDSTIPVSYENGIVNGASFATFRPLSPGSIITLFGGNLASSGGCFGGTCAGSLPLPTSLGGVRVTIGGVPAPLFYAGPNQINAQVPAELGSATLTDVIVTARGIVSTAQTVQLDATQPGIFVTSGTQGAVLNQDFSPNSASNPAARGSVIQIFATGLGPTNPAVATGAPAPSSPPFATVVNPVTVTIGGSSVPVQFQALAPGFVGLYQINVQVPVGVTPGSAVPLKIIQSGIESNEVTVAIN